MSELNFKPDAAALAAGDKLIAVPADDQAADLAAAIRHGHGTRVSRRRFSVTRFWAAADDGFRPFRVF
ncbi:MAG TPA: hypothetical protein VGL28_07840 [Steroidobacteraceae bacterium]|jgi:hypothetical protein